MSSDLSSHFDWAVLQLRLRAQNEIHTRDRDQLISDFFMKAASAHEVHCVSQQHDKGVVAKDIAIPLTEDEHADVVHIGKQCIDEPAEGEEQEHMKEGSSPRKLQGGQQFRVLKVAECDCGTKFSEDATFCRLCGKPRGHDERSPSFVKATALHLKQKSGCFLWFFNVMQKSRFNRIGLTLYNCIYCIFNAWMSIEEPQRSGSLYRLAKDPKFESVSAAIICANGAFVFFITNREMQHELGNIRDSEWESQQGSIKMIDLAFLSFYTLELVVRLNVHKIYFFCNSEYTWNWFDFLLVSFALCMDVVLPIFIGSGNNINLVFLRLMRLLKVSKLLRMVRTLRFFKELRLFLDCIKGCCSSLFWAVLMITLILALFAIYLVQTVTGVIVEHGPGPYDDSGITQDELVKYFGTVEIAMVNLLQATSGGNDWGVYYDVLSATGGGNSIVFVMFMLFFMVAVWNIVTSLFIERTMEMAKPDLDTMMVEKQRKDIEDAKELMFISTLVDTDCSNTISLEEFEAFMEHDGFRQHFDIRGIDVKDARMFFKMIVSCSETDDVDMETFVGSCLRIKGVASSIDVHTLNFEMRAMSRTTGRFFACLEEKIDKLQDIMWSSMALSQAQPLPFNATVAVERMPAVPDPQV